MPESFEQNPHKKSHKDVDARWTQKNNDVNYFCYKYHVKTDVKYKFIRDYTVTVRRFHDRNENEFLDFFPAKSDEEQMKPWQAEDFVFSDSAYVHHTEELRERGYLPRICERDYRNKPLMEEQKAGNREKSKVCCRVEHISGMTLYFPLRQDRRFKCEWVTKSCDVLVKRGRCFRSGCETSFIMCAAM